ncbi:MAG: hypothetical protein RIQ93_1982 [Verrucomicrobiota bacterium]|jgi:CubicO group peptidase (beta-lactamase class C family)
MKYLLRLVALATLCALAPTRAAEPAAYVPPAFSDADRLRRVQELVPEVDAAFAELAATRHLPGVAYGLVLDGKLIHARALGFANVEKKIPAAADTRFRIASMTKSFTALAILKLRDAGRLSLSDPVERYVSEFRSVNLLTADSGPVTLRHLLTMTAGFPEDNPWGDRQLALSVAGLQAFVRGGISFSNAPGPTYEYSNLGFALLGQVITHVTGESYQRYITRELLTPLGMTDTRWEFSEVPTEKLALGYRWENDAWLPEPLLHDGAYGAMGGLLTTLDDYARYVAFHAAAWPPRDGRDAGPVRRATLREMHQPAIVSGLVTDAKTSTGETLPLVNGYGFGLRWTMDARNTVRFGHSGGLPGFGSNWLLYPAHGLAIISFSNLTYAPMSAINTRLAALLVEQGALPPRTLPTSAMLALRERQVADLLISWDRELGDTILAENFFLDRSREAWIKLARETLARAGRLTGTQPLVPENQLRGAFALLGDTGRVEVFFTLTPEATPKIQQLRLTYVDPQQ